MPPDSAVFLAARDMLAEASRLTGYGYIELPMFAETALYTRGLGEASDVVSKETYTLSYRGGRSMTLRTEGVAGVIRSVIEHGLDRAQLPLKRYLPGPFFSCECPQAAPMAVAAGRCRGDRRRQPALAAEVIAIADAGYRALGLADYRVEINSR